MTIKPQIGDSVWYWPEPAEVMGNDMTVASGSNKRVVISSAQPFTGVVTYVWHDRMINVSGFDHAGRSFQRTSVQLMQDDAEYKPKHAHCTWPEVSLDAVEVSGGDDYPAAAEPFVVTGTGAAPAVTDAMVSRFLSWNLPGDFAPDCYISFDRESAARLKCWPTGTNLLTAAQARKMLEDVLGADVKPTAVDDRPCNDERACGACFSGQGDCESKNALEAELIRGATAVDLLCKHVIAMGSSGLLAPTEVDGRKFVVRVGPDEAKPAPPPLPKRVTPAMVDAAIESRFDQAISGTLTSVCTLKLKNGAVVVGTNYGAIDPDKHDWMRGVELAYQQARDKVFELEGYLVRQRLYEHS